MTTLANDSLTQDLTRKLGKPVTIFAADGAPHDQNTIDQLTECASHEQAVAAALCADGHLGYSMPIGGVIAYEGAVSPTGVGFDIACGNMAVRTNIMAKDIAPHVKAYMREIKRRISFGMGRVNEEPFEDHLLFYKHADIIAWLDGKVKGLEEKARKQLGTVGSGNHYVDLLADDDGYVWIANHFGSRGFGHTIATGFLNLAAGHPFDHRGKEPEGAVVLSFEREPELAAHYVAAMQAAGDYAYAGREYVIGTVLDVLGNPGVAMSVHNHHNFAWLEDGRWVVRKGATPLTREPAFIGGSMGDYSMIVRGRNADTPADFVEFGDDVLDIGNIGSAPHGAGRLMSRTQAAGKMRKMWACANNRNCTFEPFRCEGPDSGHEGNKCPACGIPLKRVRMRDLSTAKVDWADVRERLAAAGIVVLGGGADEAPQVYKGLERVIAAHSNIEIMHRLSPLGVVMASPDEWDPYKD